MTHLTTQTDAVPPGFSRLATILSRPRTIALACMGVLVTAGWVFLLLASWPQSGAGLTGFLAAICRPVTTASAGLGLAASVGAMWVAMTLAMMLPTAGPMILTYAEIAETAARKGQRIVSPTMLIAGYLAVWVGFSVLATLAQLGVIVFADRPVAQSVAVPASALLFVAAGLYQFSALKQACLTACQRPFSFFFLNWTDRAPGVFRLGVRQGLHCLGCCIAMMLLMFAAGAMNVVWMALLGLVMTLEKMSATPHFSRAVGFAFTAAGLAILAMWGFDAVG
jgi:predicted metal-binding membrane protein